MEKAKHSKVDRGTKEFEALLDYIKRSRGFDFLGYKRPSLQRRILRRMQMVNLRSDFREYTDYLEVHPDEFTHLFNTILINVTGFFRDPSVWEYVHKELVPRILKSHDGDIRVWSAACASGEEAYTIAMILAEVMGPKEFERRVKIFATDLDEEALTHARSASYSEQQVEGVPPPMLEKYFDQAGSYYVFKKDLRRAVIFGRHDLLQDAPISRIDLLICRNSLMYFNTEAQARCMERFHFALNDDGYLMLGRAEMLFSRMTLFTPLDLKLRIFAKVPRANLRDRLLLMSHGGGEQTIIPIAPGARAGEAMVDHMRVREAAFNVDPSAQVVLDPDGFLVLVNERAQIMFHLNERDVGRPLQDLELSYRPIELRSCVEKARETRAVVEMKDVPWPKLNGETMYVDCQVQPLFDAEGTLLGVKVSFQDVTRYKRLQEELQQSHQELETAYEELQSTNEERETANEELQSTNEELQTTNEEIQSSNEELETMNEELQSTNEELQATNQELRVRSEELTQVNAFFRSILASFHNGVIVVDRELRVRAWNHMAEELWGLRSEEVMGKHLLDLDMGLPLERVRPVIRDALAGNADGQVVIPARNRRGREFRCALKCVPAQSGQDGVWGVVLTMEEEHPL